YFNTTQDMDENNIALGSLSFTAISGSLPDDAPLRFEDDRAVIFYDSVNDKFVIKNEEGDILFAHVVGNEIIEFFSIRFLDGALEVFGELQTNKNKGSQDVTTQWLLSKYRKPRLQYVDSNIITVEANGPTDNTSYVMGR